MIKVSCLELGDFFIQLKIIFTGEVLLVMSHFGVWEIVAMKNRFLTYYFLSVWFLVQVVRNQFGLPNGASRTI
jgi:hypothetical protein